MPSIVGATDKLKSIIGMGFDDAELAQRSLIIWFHDPYNIALFEWVLRSHISVKSRMLISEKSNTNLGFVFVIIDIS